MTKDLVDPNDPSGLSELLRAHEAGLGGAEPPSPGTRARVVTRARRKATARAWATGAATLVLVGALGMGAWALTGRADLAPVPPAHTTAPAPVPTETTSPDPTDGSSSPSPTDAAPTVPETDALAAAYDTDAEWFRIGGLVPVDAPLATFPIESASSEAFGCTEAQLAWLEAYGVANTERVDRSWLDRLRGDAEGAAMPYVTDRSYALSNVSDPATPLTISNLRVEGAFVPRDRVRFQFGCENGGIGGSAVPDQVVALGDGSPATYYVTPGWESTPPPDHLMPEGSSGSPFTVELAAGESLGFVDLMIDSGAAGDFVGQVVADVTIDDQTYRSVLDDGYLQVGEPDVATVYALAGYGRLFCLPDPETYGHLVAGGSLEQLLPYECSPQELADMVAPAAG